MENRRSFNQDHYWIEAWGNPYFAINEKGNITVKPNSKLPEGDLYELVQSLVERGIEAPILIRFDDIIQDRYQHIRAAFKSAIKEFHYQNSYRLAFPIKVNPQFHLIELIEKMGARENISLEVGSKPELIAVLTINTNLEALLLCNGYKDSHYIELALLARKLGRRSIIIIEQFYELQLVLEIAEKLNVEAEIGFRMKLSTKGSGRWATSSGDRAKFGLGTDEIVSCLETLKADNKCSWLKLLHFHIGSQITSIESIKKALDEASRMYVELASICPSLCFFDAGGGLGVDYDGSKTTSDSSMNYSVEEYARDVVSAINDACQLGNVAHPIIITESGRALVAHHSVLITEVIDVAPMLEPVELLETPPSQHEILVDLYELYNKLTPEACQETLHDALEIKDKILDKFIHSQLNIYERAYAEKVYRFLVAKICKFSKKLSYIPDDIENLDQTLFDTYFCNFSVFQSLPDSWAIQQVFPIAPIHRLNEPATRRAILVDLSCDSDGKIDSFVSRKNSNRHLLPLHSFNDTPYYLGIFLVGAYQEIMGGLHNLFGDTNAVHVKLSSSGKWKIQQVVEGDSIEEVLSYVQFNPKQLIIDLRKLIEEALHAGRLSNEESAKLQRRFKESLESYTYLIV